jgi:hypothetical protein
MRSASGISNLAEPDDFEGNVVLIRVTASLGSAIKLLEALPKSEAVAAGIAELISEYRKSLSYGEAFLSTNSLATKATEFERSNTSLATEMEELQALRQKLPK